MEKIILTGGGTAGHVTPNIALLQSLKQENYQIKYIGTHKGIERELMEHCQIEYFGISSGKLRRYFDMKNITDAFKVVRGLSDAVKIIKKEKPTVIFSKGGFVAVPVVMAGWLCKVPVVIHESDMTPGLANKISAPFAKKICAAFPETLATLPPKKGILTGTPIRQELFQGDSEKAMSFCRFNKEKPVLLIIGGSSGSVKINSCVREALPEILDVFQTIHICGKGNIDVNDSNKGYKQFEYLNQELPDVLALADVVISRAGANAISEFVALKKPCLLIPLSKNASRGDQILNAKSFQKQGFSDLLYEEDLTPESLMSHTLVLYANRQQYIHNMSASKLNNGVEEVMKVIKSSHSKH